MSNKNEYIQGMIANKNWVFGVVCFDGEPIPTETAWKYQNNTNIYLRAKNDIEALAQAKLLIKKEHYTIFSVQEV